MSAAAGAEKGLAIRGPVHLHEQDGCVLGQVTVENGGARTARPRHAALRLDAGTWRALVFAEVAPGASARVPVNVPLGGEPLPPGEHRGTLELGEASAEVTVTAPEHVSLAFTPQRLRVSAGRGDAAARLTLHNRGNVPLRLPWRAGVGLDHPDRLTEAVHHALRTRGHRGWEEAADRATERMAGGELRPALVYFGEEPPTLQPGESRTVEVRVRLPRGLQGGRAYAGTVHVHGTPLTVEVQTHDLTSTPAARPSS
jgi:hypothetical protein